MLFNKTEGCFVLFCFLRKKMISIQYLKTWILFKLENDFALTFVWDSLELTESGPWVGGSGPVTQLRADPSPGGGFAEYAYCCTRTPVVFVTYLTELQQVIFFQTVEKSCKCR